MRGLAIVLCVVALGGVAWVMAAGGGEDPPPLTGLGDRNGGDPNRASAAPTTPLAADRAALSPAAHTAPTAAPPDTKEVAAVANARSLVVELADRSTGEPVAGFRYVLVYGDGVRDAQQIDGSTLALELAMERPVTITFESEGYEPSQPRSYRLTAAEPERLDRVLLNPAARFTGIELWVVGPDHAPVTKVEVEAFALNTDDPLAPLRRLWKRTAQDERGIFRLPDLAPETYRFRVRAVTPTLGSDSRADVVKTHMVHEEEVVFRGSERIVTTVQLRAGALLHLNVTDAHGNPLGSDVLARMVHADGTSPGTHWVGRDPMDAESHEVYRTDGLPGPWLARLAEPVAPGQYTLQLRRGEGQAVDRVVLLRGGETAHIEITLP